MGARDSKMSVVAEYRSKAEIGFVRRKRKAEWYTGILQLYKKRAERRDD